MARILEAQAAGRGNRRREAAVARSRRLLREDAREKWGLPARAGEVLFAAPLAVAALGAGLAAAAPGVFLFVSREDSILEWLQFAGFAVATVVVLLLARRRRRARDGRGALALAALAAGCLFVAGEEISWGQRIVGFEAPERIADVNRQDELTVHNVDLVQGALKHVAMAAAAAGAVLPWLAWKRGWGGSSVVPPLFLTPVFLVRFSYDVVRVVDYPTSFLSADPHRRELFAFYSEWTELGAAYVVVAFAFLAWRRSRARTGAAA